LSKGVLEGERPWLGSRRKCRGEALLRGCITLHEDILRGEETRIHAQVRYLTFIYLIIY
jgi:hypothetical protein